LSLGSYCQNNSHVKKVKETKEYLIAETLAFLYVDTNDTQVVWFWHFF